MGWLLLVFLGWWTLVGFGSGLIIGAILLALGFDEMIALYVVVTTTSIGLLYNLGKFSDENSSFGKTLWNGLRVLIIVLAWLTFFGIVFLFIRWIFVQWLRVLI
ncbi:MAG: hypothetical protein R3E79_51790 [Caldilineaceae bacterium]